MQQPESQLALSSVPTSLLNSPAPGVTAPPVWPTPKAFTPYEFAQLAEYLARDFNHNAEWARKAGGYWYLRQLAGWPCTLYDACRLRELTVLLCEYATARRHFGWAYVHEATTVVKEETEALIGRPEHDLRDFQAARVERRGRGHRPLAVFDILKREPRPTAPLAHVRRSFQLTCLLFLLAIIAAVVILRLPLPF